MKPDDAGVKKKQTNKKKQKQTKKNKKKKTKTEQLNLDKDGSKFWRLTRSMNDESSRSSPITLQQHEELLTGKKGADPLINQYVETNGIQVPWNRRQDVKKPQRDKINTPGEAMIKQPFAVAELDIPLATL